MHRGESAEQARSVERAAQRSQLVGVDEPALDGRRPEIVTEDRSLVPRPSKSVEPVAAVTVAIDELDADAARQVREGSLQGVEIFRLRALERGDNRLGDLASVG